MDNKDVRNYYLGRINNVLTSFLILALLIEWGLPIWAYIIISIVALLIYNVNPFPFVGEIATLVFLIISLVNNKLHTITYIIMALVFVVWLIMIIVLIMAGLKDIKNKTKKAGGKKIFNKKYKKNLDRFNFYIDEIMNKADAKYPTSPSCKPVLQPYIDRLIESSESIIEGWDANTDVETIVVKNIYTASANILSSGQLHVYRGMLDPMSCAYQLQFIVDECLEYYRKNGIATDEVIAEQKEIIRDNIRSMG